MKSGILGIRALEALKIHCSTLISRGLRYTVAVSSLKMDDMIEWWMVNDDESYAQATGVSFSVRVIEDRRSWLCANNWFLTVVKIELGQGYFQRLQMAESTLDNTHGALVSSSTVLPLPGALDNHAVD